jgi:hypothetical protein
VAPRAAAALVLVGVVARSRSSPPAPYLLLDFGRATFTSTSLHRLRDASASAPAGGVLDVALNFVRTRAFGYHSTVSLWHGQLARHARDADRRRARRARAPAARLPDGSGVRLVYT